MDTDFAAELEHMVAVPVGDLEEDALKYFALTILFTMTVKAGRLSFKEKGGKLRVKVVSGEEKSYLPVPPDGVARKIFEIIRDITHIDTKSGELPFVLGLPNGTVDIQVKIKKKDGGESLKLIFTPL